jgi:hypothetical protein
MVPLSALKEAADSERLLVKVERSWFLARVIHIFEIEGNWIMKIVAGPNAARGIITNVDDNAMGRDFRVLPKPLT